MATLASISARVRSVLIDTEGRIWPEAVIAEGVRLALGEYGLAAEAGRTLEGLDGAVETTLPEAHDSLLVWGAAAYAALARAVDRAESFQPGGEYGHLKQWGESTLKEYKAMLGAVFPGYLAAGGGGAPEDPAKLAAQVELLAAQAALAGANAALAGAQSELAGAQSALAGAQAGLAESNAAHVDGQESRQQAAAEAAAAARVDEAARLAELRAAQNAPWGAWQEDSA